MKPALLAVSALAIAVTAIVAIAAVGRFVDRALRYDSAVTDLIAVALAVAGSTTNPDTMTRYSIIDTLACWPDDDGDCVSVLRFASAAPAGDAPPDRRTVIVEWSPASGGAAGEAATHRPGPPTRGAIYLLGDAIAGIELLARARPSPAGGRPSLPR